MAVAENVLTSGASTVNGSSYNTASVAPADDALVLVGVCVTRGSSEDPPTPTLSGGGMAAWDVVEDNLYVTSGGVRSRMVVYRAREATPGSGAITISLSPVGASGCLWSVIEYTGVDTSGTNGSGAIAQSEQAAGSGTAVSVSLAGAPDAGSGSYGFMANDDAVTFSAAGDGFAFSHAELSYLTPNQNARPEFKNTGDQVIDGTLSSTAAWGIIGIEIAAGDVITAPRHPAVNFQDPGLL